MKHQQVDPLQYNANNLEYIATGKPTAPSSHHPFIGSVDDGVKLQGRNVPLPHTNLIQWSLFRACDRVEQDECDNEPSYYTGEQTDQNRENSNDGIST